MNCLLDTCTFIWLCSDPKSLSKPAAEQIEADDNELFLSLASALEICLKVQTGKIQLPDKPLPWISGRVAYWKIHTLDIGLDVICQSAELPDFHKDPFDRLLVSQAMIRQLTILTPDPLIKKYAVKTLW